MNYFLLLYIGLYIFLTFLSKDLYAYFDRLKDIFTSNSKFLYDLSFKILSANDQNLHYIKNEDSHSFNARRDFYTFLIISLMLFSANIFVLSQFFGSISGLGQPIFGGMSDFSFLQYSHMVAAVIIIFELGLGLLYFYFEQSQQNDPDEASYANSLLSISGIVIIMCLVEGFIWYQLSAILFEKGDMYLPIGTNPTIVEIVKGFLGFFGAAFTLGEYYYGYSISKSQNEIKSSIIVRIISIIFFSFVSLWTFLGSGILYAFHIIVWFIRLSLEFLLIPSNFVLRKIGFLND
tara:strand:+ start:1617 stop:2489 length:873 start_codon:yes stop_codon:yes gene_type:complete